MPILWKTSTEGLDGSKRPFFNLRWDVSPSRRVPPPTKGRCGSRQNIVGTNERRIRPEWGLRDWGAFQALIASANCRNRRPRGVLRCANLLTDRVIQSRGRLMGYVRDVGVAGSNSVTPTIDFTCCQVAPVAHLGGATFAGSLLFARLV